MFREYVYMRQLTVGEECISLQEKLAVRINDIEHRELMKEVERASGEVKKIRIAFKTVLRRLKIKWRSVK